jgi:hypothetical protein
MHKQLEKVQKFVYPSLPSLIPTIHCNISISQFLAIIKVENPCLSRIGSSPDKFFENAVSSLLKLNSPSK